MFCVEIVHTHVICVLDQKILTKFIEDGTYYKHLRKIFTWYGAKHALLRQLITENIGNVTKIHGAYTGLHIILEMDAAMDVEI